MNHEPWRASQSSQYRRSSTNGRAIAYPLRDTMQCYTELTPPTAVTHSLCLPFLSSTANNLIVAKTNLLQIFALKSVILNAGTAATPVNGLSDVSAINKDRAPTTKLIFVAQCELSGTVTSLARVKILKSKSGGEALLVALRDAKLSLVEWDPERYGVSTISIHYYEREDIVASPWEADLSDCVNYLTVDPSSRCAALKFGARHLAILPFHQPGDDLVMDDYDAEPDDEKPALDTSLTKDVDGQPNVTPYAASFVLSLLALDPALTHPIHISFLYEYREPTFGILYSRSATSSALLHERRDKVSFAIYTLDLEQKASTTLSSVSYLPYDIHTIVPLSRAIGGVLLIGNNEIIHVDQSGKTNGLAVNDFAKKSTSFSLGDHSDLGMRLEGCVVKQLGWDNVDLLLILNTGELAVITFRIDGRSISGLTIRRVKEKNGGLAVLAGPSCASYIGRGRLFIGSERADSLILGWSRASDRLKRQRSRVDMDLNDANAIADFDEENISDEDEDDLYAVDKPQPNGRDDKGSTSKTSSEEEYVFRVHDTLLNVGPMADIAFAPSTEKTGQASRLPSELLTTTGYGRASGLTTFRFEIHIQNTNEYDIPEASSIWAVQPKANAQEDLSEQLDKYLVATVTSDEGESKSRAYAIKSTGVEEVQNTDFEPEAGATIEVGTLNGGLHMVQVLESELRTFDGDFGLSQIFPLNDEESEDGPKVISASFADPYLLLVRDDESIKLLRADESGDLDEIEQEEGLKAGKWISGSMYEDLNDAMRLEYPEDENDEVGNVLLFLLNAAGGLHIYRLPSLRKPVYTAEGLSFLPPFLSSEFTIRRSSARENIVEILVAELGDALWNSSPYLILRSVLDDLIIYQPYQAPIEGSKDTALRFVRISNTRIPKTLSEDNEAEEDTLRRRNQPLRVLAGLDGYDTVFIPGAAASFIIKSAAGPPQVMGLAGTPIQSLSPLRTLSCPSGFVYINSQNKVQAATLPANGTYLTGLHTYHIPFSSTVSALSYHSPSDTIVVGTSTPTPFTLPSEDDSRRDPPPNEDSDFHPLTPVSTIHLLDRRTHTTISTHALDQFETILCISTVSLEISEITHERRDMVCVGTALLRGEDLPSMGRIYVFAVIDVVPEPDRLETGKAFKLVAKEETRGAVTAIGGVGTQGFLLVAMGQKIMVRGLKEDGTVLPVAFMDVQCYVSVARELGPLTPDATEGTGLCLIGDALKGVWLTGYMEDPYQLRLFGKSPNRIETIAADFLPDGKQLYIVVADADCNLHVLQFDPDNPKSLSGTRLLHHTTFHTAHYPSTLTLLPPNFNLTSKTSPPNSTQPSQESPPGYQPRPLILTSTTGSLSLLTPLPPSTHRTLSSLQTHCLNALPHALGLNPRAFRSKASSEADGGSGGGFGGSGGGGSGRGTVIDGMVVRRWEEMGSWKRWAGEEREVVRACVRLALGG